MKNESDPERLLNDILADAVPPDFRAELLDRTLNSVRRRRRQRQWGQGLLAATIILGASFMLWRTNVPKHSSESGQPSAIGDLSMVSSSPLKPSMLVESAPGSVQIVSSFNSTAAMLVETGVSDPSLQLLNDQELLAFMGGKPAIIVRESPRHAELLVVDSGTQSVRAVGELPEKILQ
ncbi:MAG: hypothetical protein JWR26_3122 [Pedosphaera sp.]|nr:hypothetical protein [Pedosphaera sp.]